MILINKRLDLAYKTPNNVIMINNSLFDSLSFEVRMIYSFIANFDCGLDTKYIFELMEPKGWSKDMLNNSINSLLELDYIEDISEYADEELIRKEFEELKKCLK